MSKMEETKADLGWFSIKANSVSMVLKVFRMTHSFTNVCDDRPGEQVLELIDLSS